MIKVKVPNQSGYYNLKVEPIKTLYYNHDTNYAVIKCFDLDDKIDEFNFDVSEFDAYEKVTLVGIMPKLIIGKTYKLTAEKVSNERYGEQYKVQFIENPTDFNRNDEHSLIAELVSDTMFNEIIKQYDLPVTAIKEDFFDYKKIKYMRESQFHKIKSIINDTYGYMSAFSEFSKYGLSFKMIKKIVEYYGSAELATTKVKSDPYVLYRSIKGVGFQKADYIAKLMGFAHDSPQRMLSGIVYALELEEQSGNIWSNLSYIKEKSEELLRVVIKEFDEYIKNDIFYVDIDIISLSKLRNCEVGIKDEIFRLANSNIINTMKNFNVAEKVKQIQVELNIEYSDEQLQLFDAIVDNNFLILTGFAGSGKTCLLNGCLKMLESHMYNIILVSPTAKASKVLSNSTGRDATTIHRALKWTYDGFIYNKYNKLKCDLIVVDEASMIDIFLFKSLLEAIPDGCKVILVGDSAQLESIAVGNVLHDIINSKAIKLVALTKVYRQALESGIYSVATDVRQGKKFYILKTDIYQAGLKNDFKIWFSQKEEIPSRLIVMYKECLKKWKAEDILVISPMKKGKTGIHNLNKLIQSISNPPDCNKKEVFLTRCVFRVGDKVRHTKNDYDANWYDYDYQITDRTGVFNGEFGIIKHICEDSQIYVDYGDRIIIYKNKPYEYLELAYAITAHASQGSQSPVVIGCLDISHYLNLKRNLLYTMITRASDRMYLLAERQALSMAILNNTVPTKRTFLSELLNKK